MDELTFAAVVSWAIPPIVSMLKSRSWPSWLSMAFVGAASFGVAVLALLVTGEIDLANGIQNVDVFFAAAGVAFMESQVVYRLIMKQVPQLERANEALTTFPFRPKGASDPNVEDPQEALPLGENAPDPGPPASGPGANPGGSP